MSEGVSTKQLRAFEKQLATYLRYNKRETGADRKPRQARALGTLPPLQGHRTHSSKDRSGSRRQRLRHTPSNGSRWEAAVC